MRKLLATPVQMPLSDSENMTYQNVLKYVAEISLNLMAIKVEEDNRPTDFLTWCKELNRLCRHELNLELLEPNQLAPLKKLQDTLESGISAAQLKMLRIAPWPVFSSYIQENSEIHALTERLKLVDYCQQLQNQTFADLIEEDLLTLAGKHTAKHDISVYDFDVEWFSACRGAKAFVQLILEKPTQFEQALAEIPLTGDVSKAQYQAFVSAYKTIFTEANETNAPLVPATRLLALRRPDQFIALTNSKIDLLCQGFSIAKFNNRNFEAYWQDMIETMRQFAWWRASEPTDESELAIWRNRAILVDIFLYADETLAPSSHYIKMKNKPTKTSKRGEGTRSKRSKESIAMLVDKALAADDIPPYLLSKRDSIISEVAAGKSIDKVIGLLRSIFG